MKRQIRILGLVAMMATGCGPSASVPSTPIWTVEERNWLLSELDRTTSEVLAAVDDLTDEQWYFKETADRWCLVEIIEHLEVQNELHMRELYAGSNSPRLPQYIALAQGQDAYFTSYATRGPPGKAQWFLEPIGRFCSPQEAIEAFQRARAGLRDFIEKTEVDLRQHVTFRKDLTDAPTGAVRPGDVRDLHQLVLTGIAHTDRHLGQMAAIKAHPAFPR